ncbi:hypothetical protein JSY36_13255 [Bacillus sp. H-16]|uniref:hypothetical protein n=1 Tax=Alteribacter salitolerans TaxID=2912333 RepID=UPI0019657F3A|nr:hypothetical protein [Alteribacter salitolerans]MBM7096708.1 hypothetical protein [Alteribacter salitolerans]
MNELSKGWKIRHSLYFLWFLTILFFFIAFLHIGIRASNRRWMLYSLLYALPFLISFMLFILGVLPVIENLLFNLGLVGFILGIVHAFLIRKDYLRQLAVKQGKLDSQVTPAAMGLEEAVEKWERENPEATDETGEQTSAPAKRLKEAKSNIKTGWITGVILASFNVVLVLFMMFFNPDFLGIVWADTFIDIALMFLLSLGIYKASRFCAVSLLLYYWASQLFLRFGTEFSNAASLFMVAVFSYFFIQGIRGTYQYHKLKKEMLPAVEDNQSQGA